MSEFVYRNGVLHAEQTPMTTIAENFGTPCYVYSRAAIEQNWRAFEEQLPAPHQACYAVKANSNLAVLQVLALMGAGFDVVSGGEIARVLQAGGDAGKIVFSGVGKSRSEIEYALDAGIAQFNVESSAELERISEIASARQLVARVSLRVNPDVDAKTHPYIATGLEANKFGIPMGEAMQTYRLAAGLPGLQVIGADCHIGSQLTEIEPFLDAMDRMLQLIDKLAAEGIQLTHLDMGGGLGVAYADEKPPAVADYIQALLGKLVDHPQLALYLEPGRAIVANAGVMLTRVEYIKESEKKDFVIVDAGMNDMLRPSLYQAFHEILNVREQSPSRSKPADIVGPVCETGDFLGHNRTITASAGDLLAVKSAGAYGFAMSSNYNTRVRPAELMVDGDQVHIIRQREQLEQLWQSEHLLP
ncbi:diaminopimelate decarboxylase [Aliidiomarina minuta]|uniref:Diaminopimelate decarboxylase n=1 Tax=Aliidiomarina minuta TaxID=880057 RepID=A0A432W3C2_9GAMM|nr:diaminopimelate decarboxylase [Aliidiomarina minuta]RUO23837.1 diaminopimelate decarboxylase [Aliidiomarina minuta]